MNVFNDKFSQWTQVDKSWVRLLKRIKKSKKKMLVQWIQNIWSNGWEVSNAVKSRSWLVPKDQNSTRAFLKYNFSYFFFFFLFELVRTGHERFAIWVYKLKSKEYRIYVNCVKLIMYHIKDHEKIRR